MSTLIYWIVCVFVCGSSDFWYTQSLKWVLWLVPLKLLHTHTHIITQNTHTHTYTLTRTRTHTQAAPEPSGAVATHTHTHTHTHNTHTHTRIPKIHQVETLRFLGLSQYKFKSKFWLGTRRRRGFSPAPAARHQARSQRLREKLRGFIYQGDKNPGVYLSGENLNITTLKLPVPEVG